MSQVSKYPIDKDKYKEIYDVFIEVIAGLKTKQVVNSFLNEFLSPTEKVMLVKRLAVGIFVAKGLNYREIGDLLKMSTSTIAEYNLAYKYNSGYKEIINKALRSKLIESLICEFIEGFAELELLGNPKSKRWIEVKRNVKHKKQNTII